MIDYYKVYLWWKIYSKVWKNTWHTKQGLQLLIQYKILKIFEAQLLQ